jgi:hypothetical protein
VDAIAAAGEAIVTVTADAGYAYRQDLRRARTTGHRGPDPGQGGADPQPAAPAPLSLRCSARHRQMSSGSHAASAAADQARSVLLRPRPGLHSLSDAPALPVTGPDKAIVKALRNQEMAIAEQAERAYQHRCRQRRAHACCPSSSACRPAAQGCAACERPVPAAPRDSRLLGQEMPDEDRHLAGCCGGGDLGPASGADAGRTRASGPAPWRPPKPLRPGGPAHALGRSC